MDPLSLVGLTSLRYVIAAQCTIPAASPWTVSRYLDHNVTHLQHAANCPDYPATSHQLNDAMYERKHLTGQKAFLAAKKVQG